MIVGVPKESYPNERRVALVPAAIPSLTKAGFEVVVEANAGDQAGYRDAAYVEKGAKIQATRADVFGTADIIVQVLCYGANDITGKADLALLRKDQVLIGFLRPLGSAEVVQQTCGHRRDVVLSGTRATNDTCSKYGRVVFNGDNRRVQSGDDGRGRITANFPHAYDRCGNHYTSASACDGCGRGRTASNRDGKKIGSSGLCLRPASRGERAGAKPRCAFRRASHRGQGRAGRPRIRNGAGRSILCAPARASHQGRGGKRCGHYDCRRSGKKAPVLVTTEMVKGMAPGSVIFDLAAERGGNCESTRVGQTVIEHGVTIIGAVNVASDVPYHASQMYARNITTFLAHMAKDGKLQINVEDDIIRETLLTRGGEVVNTRVREFLSLPALVAK